MRDQSSLLRKESFGGTLSNAHSGKRLYVSQEEYNSIKELQKLPLDLRIELNAPSNEVIIMEPEVLPDHNFSGPDTIFFEITRACNLTCEHCFNNSGNRLPFELSDGQRRAIITNLCDSGVQEIRFTGGEPLVVSAVFKYITYIRNRGVRASIGTNGALIDFNVAKRLADAGLNTAITSIDGMEEKHDLIRGSGSFQKTLLGIQSLLDVNIPVRVNTVAMKSNMQEIPLITEYFYLRNIPIMIRRLIPSGRADNMMKEMLTEEDYALLRDTLKPFISDKRGIVRGHYLQNDNVEPRIKLPFERRSCSAGHRGLVVLPDGLVQTCGFLGPLGENSIGDLKSETLASLWQRLTESQHIASLRALLPTFNETTLGPKTNCLAIALAGGVGTGFVQIQRNTL
ncbi:MAG: radical SAM/SPASM domain-containing protein [Minisyncoccota bacterium]